MTKYCPPRIRKALSLLSPQPQDTILEIGCGTGQAVRGLVETGACARLVALDRSATMIEQARRNLADIPHQWVEFIQSDLAKMRTAQEPFDKIFAINVNLFWLDGKRETEIVRSLLAPRGKIWLFYQPPSADKNQPIADKVSQTLQHGGFDIEQVVDDISVPFLAIAAVHRVARYKLGA